VPNGTGPFIPLDFGIIRVPLQSCDFKVSFALPPVRRVRDVYDREKGFFERMLPKEPLGRSNLLVNPLFDLNKGKSLHASAMAYANDGGDQGGFAEEPARPKLFGRRALLLEGNVRPEYKIEAVRSSNCQAPTLEGLVADEEKLVTGKVEMDNDVLLEDEPDESPAPSPVPCMLIARYLG
jgi:hypothetical protein